VTSFLQDAEMLLLANNISTPAITSSNPRADRQAVKTQSGHENSFVTSGGAALKTIRPLQE
jgi:hypothetical protein